MPTSRSGAVLAYQPPLTPVSESDTTTETASLSNATTSSATSPASERSYLNAARARNFSRPRPTVFSSPDNRVHHDYTDSYGLSVESWSRPVNRRSLSLPDVPRFRFGDDDEEDNAVCGASSDKELAAGVSEFNWEDHLRDMKPAPGLGHHQRQRSLPQMVYMPSGARPVDALRSVPRYGLQRSRSESAPEVVIPSGKTEAVTPTQHPALRAKPSVPVRKSSAPSAPRPNRNAPVIQEVIEEDWDGEDVASHHTVSENGDVAELDAKSKSSSQWSGSSYDVSEVLSEKEIKKLKKKGINPALYAEMKAARKGRRGVNILSGNAYLL